jgi:hypothetical protein
MAMSTDAEVDEAMLGYWRAMGEMMPEALAEAIEARGGIAGSEDLMQAFMAAMRRATLDFSEAVGIEVDLEVTGAGDGAALQ